MQEIAKGVINSRLNLNLSVLMARLYFRKES